jgi:hypothetical protein
MQLASLRSDFERFAENHKTTFSKLRMKLRTQVVSPFSRRNQPGSDEVLGASYSNPSRPGVGTRLMVALHYLKYQHNLSDEAVVAHWLLFNGLTTHFFTNNP